MHLLVCLCWLLASFNWTASYRKVDLEAAIRWCSSRAMMIPQWICSVCHGLMQRHQQFDRRNNLRTHTPLLNALALVLLSSLLCFPVTVCGQYVAIVSSGTSTHTCGLTSYGGVRCWGDNSNGQLGNGSTGGQVRSPPTTDVLTNVSALAVSASNTCALTAGGGVRCWGDNSFGQIGNGSGSGQLNVPSASDVLSNVSAIAVGDAYTCALTMLGGVRCWGLNGNGQLGNGWANSTTNILSPPNLDATTNISAIAAGGYHTCALTLSPTRGVICWGNNTHGQLGNGWANSTSVPSPPTTTIISNVSAIAAGYQHTCALMAWGGVRCWGDNSFGQLGNSSFGTQLTSPPNGDVLTNVSAIAAGAYHTCALMTSTGVRCWGYNANGQLGNGSSSGQLNFPPSSDVLTSVGAITCGFFYSCALMIDGGFRCWGANGVGELGIGVTSGLAAPPSVDTSPSISITSSVTPTRTQTSTVSASVSPSMSAAPTTSVTASSSCTASFTPTVSASSTPVLLHYTAIVTGTIADRTCGITSSGGLRCWGNNPAGELGNGVTGTNLASPPTDDVLSNVSTVAMGGEHTCALMAWGGVRCWGYNVDGQLGNGYSNTTDVTVPPSTDILTNVSAITAGYVHTCALMAWGGVTCWGYNSYGQLGNGYSNSTCVPTPPAAYVLTNVSAIVAGNYHTCALMSWGGVRCWGSNVYGQLGNGYVNSTYVVSPPTFDAITSVSLVVAGYGHTCALMTWGGLRCWGYNNCGQCGNGNSGANVPSPPVSDALTSVRAASVGDYFSCALMTWGGVRCWGSNSAAQLGNGYRNSSTYVVWPPTTDVLSGVIGIACGANHVCALMADGGFRCWGDYTYGQLGNGNPSVLLYPPSVDTSPSITLSISRTAAMSQSPSRTAAASVSPSYVSTHSSTRTLTTSATESLSVTSTFTVSSTATSTRSLSATPSLSSSASVSVTPTSSGTVSVTATGSSTGTSSVTLSGSASATLSLSSSATASLSTTVSRTPSPSATLSGTATESATNSGTMTVTPSGSPSVSNSASLSVSLTLTATGSGTGSCSMTGSGTVSNTVSSTRTTSSTPSVTSTSSATGSRSVSPSPTLSSSSSATLSATLTPTESASVTPSSSVTNSESPSPTPSLSFGASPSTTSSGTLSASHTPSNSPANSWTATVSSTASPTFTRTVSTSASGSVSPTCTISSTYSPSQTVSVSRSASPSGTSSDSTTFTTSMSPTRSASVTASMSLSPSTSSTVTTTGTVTDTVTSTRLPSPTASVSSTMTVTASSTTSSSITVTSSQTTTVTQTPCPIGCTVCASSNCSACDAQYSIVQVIPSYFQCKLIVRPINVICTVADDSSIGAVLNCSSISLSPLEEGMSLDVVTTNNAGVPHPFVIAASNSGSYYSIAIGPELNSDIAPSLSFNVLSMPQYVIGASVCEPQATSAFVMNGSVVDFEACKANPSALARFNITVTLIHIDKPPYFTVSSLNITTSAVGVIGDPIWIPLVTVMVNPDPVFPFNMTSFLLLSGTCIGTPALSPLPFAIGAVNGSLYYSVNGSLGAWPSPLSLCVLAVDGGQLNGTLDVTVWLAPVPEQLIVSPSSVNVTHYAPGASNASVSVLFSPGSHTNVSWIVQPSLQSWLTATAIGSSSIMLTFDSRGLVALGLPAFQTLVVIRTTDSSLNQSVSVWFALGFGSGSISPLSISQTMQPLFTAASSFQMFNAGPGPLSFSVAPSSRAVYAALGVGNDVPWGTVTPVYGVIPAQQSFTFALNASSLLLPPGSFGTTLVIHTNQPLGLLTPSVPVDQSISVSDGQVFSIPWSVQVVAAIAFPAQVNASLSPYQSVREVVSVANFAGTALVLLPSTTAVWVRTDDAVMIIPAGSVSSFSILLSYPLWSNGSVVNPGSNVTANITFGCWRADATKAASSSVSAPELASLLNVSASSLPGYPYFSPISLNVVTAAVSTVVGPPNATLSFAQLLTPPSVPVNVGPGVRIRLSIRDKAGYAVQPTDDVIGLVGLQFHYQVGDVLNGNSTALGSVVSIVPSADQSAFLITAQPLVLGVLLLSVTLNGSSVGAPLSVTVFTADCAVNETAVNGLICACSAGYFYNDSTHCLPCPAGSYKPVPGNGGRTSCLPCSTGHYCLQGASEPSGECPSSRGFYCSSGVLTISPGYWSPPTAGSAGGVDPTQSNTSLTVYKCLSVDACVGGSVSDAQLVIPSVCADGYVGELCGGCDSGWANTGGGKCVRCHSGGALIFSLIVFPAIVLAVLAVLVAIVVHNPRQKSQAMVAMHNWMSGKRELLFANLRLLFELLQMTGLLMGMGSFEPQWLVVTTSALSGAAVGAGFSVTTWAPWICVIGDDIVTQMWAQLILLASSLPMGYCIARMSLPLSRLIWKDRVTTTNFRNRFFVSLCLLLYAMFLGCVRTAAMGAIVGRKPGSGVSTFGSNVTVNVSQQTHSIVRIACLTALGVMGATAFVVGMLVLKHIRRSAGLPIHFTVVTIGFKITDYRFTTEALLLLRKLAVIVAGIAFQDAFWAVVACLSSYIVVWKLLIRWKPYATQGSQFDARLVQAIILLLLLLMLARLSGNFPVEFLAVVEAMWCTLYFVTLIHLCSACVRAYRATLSTPELIRDFEASKSSRRSAVREIAKYKLRTGDTLEYTRSSRVGYIERQRQGRHSVDAAQQLPAGCVVEVELGLAITTLKE